MIWRLDEYLVIILVDHKGPLQSTKDRLEIWYRGQSDCLAQGNPVWENDICASWLSSNTTQNHLRNSDLL